MMKQGGQLFKIAYETPYALRQIEMHNHICNSVCNDLPRSSLKPYAKSLTNQHSQRHLIIVAIET